ncbi:hypothetical protein GCM10010435_34480 [Winogradskya consettensis]|uniref:Uncharacterized protein n=1 Tax=Winogradskya consettensis TaxID=113560 RepID=A0A919VSZ7_9ACTN|nr:hypothetical protein Aco04nite_39800 [Actinoplanes consettensis]
MGCLVGADACRCLCRGLCFCVAGFCVGVGLGGVFGRRLSDFGGWSGLCLARAAFACARNATPLGSRVWPAACSG